MFRYDKLYMGNHVFFYNDKTGRVERLNYATDSNNSYNSSLVDTVITSDWGRRPRSKYSSRSRPITPVQVLTNVICECESISPLCRPSPGRTRCLWTTSVRMISMELPSRHRSDPAQSPDAPETEP